LIQKKGPDVSSGPFLHGLNRFSAKLKPGCHSLGGGNPEEHWMPPANYLPGQAYQAGMTEFSYQSPG
jgi:hypothetical protein